MFQKLFNISFQSRYHLHVVVEELLKLLVDEVDGDLLEAVVLKDLEAGDVQHGAEVRFLSKKLHYQYVLYSALALRVASISVLLHLMISHLKSRSKMALAII